MNEPYCLSLIMCDTVFQDPATRKCYITGTINQVYVPTFPADVSFGLYIALTDGSGDSDLKIRVVSAEAGAVARNDPKNEVCSISATITVVDPLATLDLALNLGTVFEHAGVYHLEVWAGDQMLMARRFRVTEGDKAES